MKQLKDICPERDGENICPACPKVHVAKVKT